MNRGTQVVTMFQLTPSAVIHFTGSHLEYQHQREFAALQQSPLPCCNAFMIFLME